MPESFEELPLFPLRTVLFPHATLRLHVFEPRYRAMVQDCLKHDGPFGIALIRNGEEVGEHAEPYLVGTVARISKVETYEDGRMDIEVHGEGRFRIRHLDENSYPYLIGHVEPVEEHGEPEADDPILVATRATFEALMQRYFERQRFSVQVVFPSDPRTLSFTVANLLPIDDLGKQRLLEITDTRERLEELLPYLQASLLELRPAAPAREYVPLAANDLEDWATPN